MNFFSNLFRRKILVESVEQNEAIFQQSTEMTAKEKQSVLVRETLKPLLKAEGYKTTGNKWWRIDEPFFNFIELQNFSWNSRNSVDFCFNFTTGLTSDIKNIAKPTIHDGIPYVRENYFGVTKHIYWKGNNGYHIDDNTDLVGLTVAVLNDFNSHILPKLNLLNNENAITAFYSDKFWAPRVKQSLEQGLKNIRIDS